MCGDCCWGRAEVIHICMCSAHSVVVGGEAVLVLALVRIRVRAIRVRVRVRVGVRVVCGAGGGASWTRFAQAMLTLGSSEVRGS